jgi:hypothetical protein
MLSGIPKPHVLDLGRLTGPNIEWLIQRGFKVYVLRLYQAQYSDLVPTLAAGEKDLPKAIP